LHYAAKLQNARIKVGVADKAMCNVLAELDHRLQLVEKPNRFDFVEMKRRQFAKALAQEFRFILCVERTLLAICFAPSTRSKTQDTISSTQ
jgi:hypothetical protein